MRRRRFLGAVGGALIVGAAGAWTIGDVIPQQADAGTKSAETTPATVATATVVRGDLGTTREFKANVSFGDQWALSTTASGTVTASKPDGAIVDFGEELLRIDERPLVLVEGEMPIYRELYKVDTRGRDEAGKRLKLQEGPDVAQLQTFLIGAGYDAGKTMEADGIFGTSTTKAVKAWQKAVGLPETGRVDGSQIIFAPEPVRVAEELRVGDPFQGLTVTKANAAVLVDTSNRDRSALAVGTDVSVLAPDGSSVDGTTTSQEQTTAADGSRIWRTTVDTRTALATDASAVTVEVTDIVATDVLLVPVSALLALAEGGFAVEVPADDGSTLIRVEVGEVLDAKAEIRGDVEEGTAVVIPT